MKLMDALLGTILKRGFVGELKDFKTEILIPAKDPNAEPVKMLVSADLLQIRIDKD